jgi:hypothetical protein
MCVGYIDLGNGVRPTARGGYGDIFAAHGGDKNWFVAAVDWNHGAWVDGYLCLRLPSRTQVGYCEIDKLQFLLKYVYKLYCYQIIFLCKYLTIYFSLQVKNKLSDGIAFPVFFYWSRLGHKQHCTYIIQVELTVLFQHKIRGASENLEQNQLRFVSWPRAI